METNPIPPAAAPAAQPLSVSEERTWSTLAHLSVLLNLVTGFAGPIAALVIYLVFRDRSRRVAYDALQSMIFQLVFWYGGGILIGAVWAIVGILSAILVGVILIPFALLFTLFIGILPLIALVYGIAGAVQVNEGHDFRYWLVGDWVRGALTGA